MPAPVQDVYVTATHRINLEPAQNNFHSLLLLAKAQKISGLGAWITETADAMTSDEKERHRLVVHGLYYASRPLEKWPSFRDYLDHLESIQPDLLQEKLLIAYDQCRVEKQDLAPTTFDKSQVLSDFNSYLEFLRQCFEPEHIDRELESQAFAYLSDPPLLKELVHSHLEHMWEKYLKDEWSRTRPIMMESIDAFHQADFNDKDRQASFEFITGRTVPEGWEAEVDDAFEVTYIPSAHIGPYLGLIELPDGLCVVFGARLPEGAKMSIPDLSRAEILVRLSALADDTRLQILKLISDEGELRSQDIMHRLNLSQSATSRHLSQLSATGYLIARRCEGAKCYDIHFEKIDDTLNAISSFLHSL